MQGSNLTDYKQWILWSRETRDNNTTKVLYQVDSIERASASDPATWSTYDQVINAEYPRDGIGFVFTENDPYCGVDLDSSLVNGEMKPWAREIVESLNSYTEVSPSGTGLHIIIKAKLPVRMKIAKDGKPYNGSGRKWKLPQYGPKDAIELYDNRRYFTYTGNIFGGHDQIRECQAELDALYCRLDPPEAIREPKAIKSPMQSVTITAPTAWDAIANNDLIARAKAASNGAKFSKLFSGDAAAYGGDESAADMALCCLLAFWTNKDPSRMDTLFRQSKLYRAKWERADYRDATIDAACARCQFTYDPAYRQNEAASETTGKPDPDITMIESIMADTTPPLPSKPTKLHKVWKMNELCADTSIVQPHPIIDGILRRGEVMNLVAGAKSRKSWAILDAAISISQGSLWMGRFQCKKSSVLIIDNELRTPTLKHRSQTVCDAKGIQPTGDISILPVRGETFTIKDVITYINHVKPDVVVLDALYRFFPEKFDENSNADMTRLYNDLDVIATKTGCALIIVHHASKGTQSLKSVTDVGAGAGAQSRAADAHLAIRPLKPDGDSTKDEMATLDIVARNFAPTGRVHIKWEYPLWKVTEASLIDVKSDSELLAEFVQQFYRIDPEAAGTIWDRAEAAGLSKRKFDDHRKRALDSHLIACEREGRAGKLYKRLPTTNDTDKPF